MPRVSYSSDYLLPSPCRSIDLTTNRFVHYSRPTPSFNASAVDEEQANVSPREIDEILSRKLYEQLKRTAHAATGNVSPRSMVDPELMALIDRFFHLTYLNTIPMVNLLATAVATNFLKENIRELDRNLQEQQVGDLAATIKRGSSLLFTPSYNSRDDDDDDDDDLSWVSAPT